MKRGCFFFLGGGRAYRIGNDYIDEPTSLIYQTYHGSRSILNLLICMDLQGQDNGRKIDEYSHF